MKMFRLLVVDDEPLIRAGIRDIISERGAGIEIVAECESVSEAVDVLRSKTLDLVLLDIELPDGKGFDVVRRIGPSRMPCVVFVTAYDKYAIQAFEVNAVDYLLKPFDQSRLLASIARVRDRLAGSGEPLARRLEALLEEKTHWPQTLVVRNGDRFDFVSVMSVDWIEAANNYVVLHCGASDHILGETMSSLESRLDPSKFVRVHRSAIVHVARIVTAHAMLGGVYELKLRDGTHINTGRQYRDRIRKLLGA